MSFCGVCDGQALNLLGNRLEDFRYMMDLGEEHLVPLYQVLKDKVKIEKPAWSHKFVALFEGVTPAEVLLCRRHIIFVSLVCLLDGYGCCVD